ncbi:hypothetical protein DYB34_010952, partial [Aphanomyces astaci]
MNYIPILCHNQADLTMPTAAEKLSDIHRAIAYVKRSRGNETKAGLWKKLRVHVDKIKIEVAGTACHTVTYTPPYHSDLQPIQIAWAIVKCQ